MRQLAPGPLQDIKRWEARGGIPELEAYLDDAGVPTIGFGTTRGVKMGQRITAKQAEEMLLRDVREACNTVDSAVRVTLNDNQFGALVSLVYNIGSAAFRASTLLRKLNNADYDSVPAEMMRWNKITDPVTRRKRVLPGLTNRRAAEIGLWARGSTVAGEATPVVGPSKSPSSVARSPEVVGSVVGGGATVATVATLLNDSANQVSAVNDGSDPVRMLILGFVLLSVLIGIGTTVWAIVKRTRD